MILGDPPTTTTTTGDGGPTTTAQSEELGAPTTWATAEGSSVDRESNASDTPTERVADEPLPSGVTEAPELLWTRSVTLGMWGLLPLLLTAVLERPGYIVGTVVLAIYPFKRQTFD